MAGVAVVDNVPSVPGEKFEKLSTVIRKLFGQVGNIRDNGLWMPIDEETGLSKGFAFIEFMNPAVGPLKSRSPLPHGGPPASLPHSR